MISSVRGTVLLVEADSAVVEVGGVGLSVAVTAGVARSLRVGDITTLHTTLIVRDDALSLFGFARREELTVFSLLRGVTGVGPKSALGVLSALDVDQIAEAVAAEDDAPFRRVSGIGPKTAKLIVVQLAGKLSATPSAATGARIAGDTVAAQVVIALVGLGWSERIATDATAAAAAEASASERVTVPTLLRTTLAALGPARKERVDG